MTWFHRHLPIVLIAGLAWAPAQVSAAALKVGGTGSATEMMRQIGRVYADQVGGKIEVVPSLGSSGGIAALSDGALDFAVSGRPLKQSEKNTGLSEAMVVRTPYVMATSHRAPNGLTSKGIGQLYADEKAAWADGSPIRIILRPKSESDTAVLGGMFPGMVAAIETVRSRAEVPIAATDQDNARMAEEIPGSLVGTTYTQTLMEKRNLRLVRIDGVEPTLENFETGAYPHAKLLYLIAPRPTKSPEVERFLAFLNSPEGRKALRETGNFPVVD